MAQEGPPGKQHWPAKENKRMPKEGRRTTCRRSKRVTGKGRGNGCRVRAIHCATGVFAVDRRLPVINFGLADSRTRGLADSRTRGLADSRTRGLSGSAAGMRIVVARMPASCGAAFCLDPRFPESSPPRRPFRFHVPENTWPENTYPLNTWPRHIRPENLWPDDGAPGPTRAGRLLQTGRIPSQYTPPGRIPHERIRPVRRQARNRDERAVRTGWARTRANVPGAMNGPCAAANALTQLTQLTQGTHGLSATQALSADRPVRTFRPVPDFKCMNNQHIQHGRHSHGQTDRDEKR